MITHDTFRHNAAAGSSCLNCRGGLILLLLVFPILAVTACSRDAGTRGKPSAQATKSDADCAVTTDTSAWTAFKGIADRISSGSDMTKEELDAFGDLPTVTLWRQSLEPDVLSAQRVGNWLEGTFWQELGREGKQKRNSDRTNFIRSYRYSLDYRDRIDERLAELTGPRKCEVGEIVRSWVDADLLPETLTIHFLPSKSGIRIFEGSLLVDTGLVGAGRVDQVIGQMASLYYRKYQFMPGPNPMEVDGAEAVAHSIRVMMNEGIAGWIEKTADFHFHLEHPVLKQVVIVPEDFFLRAQWAIGHLNRKLPPMLEDETELSGNGRALATNLAAGNAYSQAGYCMSAVIVARLGEDRLRTVSRSVPAFLAAYQEAASMNPVPVPVPGEPGSKLFQTVPPLDPEIFTGLQSILARVFPEL